MRLIGSDKNMKKNIILADHNVSEEWEFKKAIENAFFPYKNRILLLKKVDKQNLYHFLFIQYKKRAKNNSAYVLFSPMSI